MKDEPRPGADSAPTRPITMFLSDMEMLALLYALAAGRSHSRLSAMREHLDSLFKKVWTSHPRFASLHAERPLP